MTDIVVAYRGAFVFSRDAWIADAKARGGSGPLRVGRGFFHDAAAFRFGEVAPFTYELAPAWLLLWDGIDVASDEASRALGAIASGGDKSARLDAVVSDELPGDPNKRDGGVKPWIVGAVAVGGLAVYAMGVTAGVFPSIGKLLKK